MDTVEDVVEKFFPEFIPSCFNRLHIVYLCHFENTTQSWTLSAPVEMAVIFEWIHKYANKFLERTVFSGKIISPDIKGLWITISHYAKREWRSLSCTNF